MDANDAASYVQELAGDNANIIFGAMYDDTYADEASITVIATGLDDGTAEEKKRTAGGIRRTWFPTTAIRSRRTDRQAAIPSRRHSHSTPSVPSPSANAGRMRAPESKVAEKDIQIPDFLKRN